jgi:magnesium chelatase family protein
MEVPAVQYHEIASPLPAESSDVIRKRVCAARAIQKQRYREDKIFFNAAMPHKQIKKHCAIDKESSDLLKNAIEKFRLSMRAHDKILKIARTISDLEASENISPAHIAEAIQYRSLDRPF